MNILVTGSAGYIGKRLVPHFKRAGHTVFGADRNGDGHPDLDRFTKGDLLEEKVLREALRNVDFVAHLAAAKDDFGISDELFFRENTDVTRELIRVAHEQGIRDWIFYSTVATIGPSATPANEQAPMRPNIAYGASKVEAEKLFHELAKSDPQVRVAMIRPSVVFGENNYETTNIHRLMDAIHRNRFLMIGKGREIKTTSYIDNLLAATMFLFERMQDGAMKSQVETYIYVDDPPMTTGELVQEICKILGKKPPSWSLPLALAVPIASVSDVIANTTKINLPITAARIAKFCTPTNFDASAIRQLGFKQPVSNEEALKVTADWYLSSRNH